MNPRSNIIRKRRANKRMGKYRALNAGLITYNLADLARVDVFRKPNPELFEEIMGKTYEVTIRLQCDHCGEFYDNIREHQMQCVYERFRRAMDNSDFVLINGKTNEVVAEGVLINGRMFTRK